MNRSTLLLSVVLCATAMTTVRIATAEPAPAEPAPAESMPPPDVALHEQPPRHRTLTLEWNPLALFIDRFSVNAVLAPGDHHALVLSPFYTWANTVPYGTSLDASGAALMNANGNPYTLNVLAQTFHGFGGELGYRYYFDLGGPRGLFIGPSLILAAITATAGNGSQTSFADFGFAADVGYEALLADTIAVSVGAGAQYAWPSKSIPDQQLPASIYANKGVQPRLLLSFGYAF
jgi:hypothetical protein